MSYLIYIVFSEILVNSRYTSHSVENFLHPRIVSDTNAEDENVDDDFSYNYIKLKCLALRNFCFIVLKITQHVSK